MASITDSPEPGHVYTGTYYIQILSSTHSIYSHPLFIVENSMATVISLHLSYIIPFSSSLSSLSSSSSSLLLENDWNTSSSLSRNPYYYSKKLAEKAAWDFVKDHNSAFQLVVINVSTIININIDEDHISPPFSLYFQSSVGGRNTTKTTHVFPYTFDIAMSMYVCIISI